MKKRKRLVDLLKAESVRPKKYTSGIRQVVVLPPPLPKKNLTDFQYGKDIDEKVVKMACGLAEKMAIAMVRETLSHVNTAQITDHMLDTITDKIIKALPEQKTVIQRVVSEGADELQNEMKDLIFEGADLAIDRSKGLKLHGDIGEKSVTKESTDDTLDLLDNLEL